MSYPTELSVQYLCNDGEGPVTLPTRGVCVVDSAATIHTSFNLPVDHKCDVQLEFGNASPEITMRNLTMS